MKPERGNTNLARRELAITAIEVLDADTPGRSIGAFRGDAPDGAMSRIIELPAPLSPVDFGRPER